MPEDGKEQLPHILVTGSADTHPYTSPRSGPHRPVETPKRNRKRHAQELIARFEQLRDVQDGRTEQQRAIGMDAFNGIYLTFESDPGFELKFESLDIRASGIELCAVKDEDNRMLATVFVPEGKLDVLLNKVVAYRDQDTPKRKPRNQKLIDSIANIREAALKALWTDDPALFPDSEDPAWWEVWLCRSGKIDYEGFFRARAEQLGMEVRPEPEAVRFLERSVVLVRATRQQMSQSVHLLRLSLNFALRRRLLPFSQASDARNRRNGLTMRLHASKLPATPHRLFVSSIRG